MDIDEPQEWYKLIRKRLSQAQFPKYSWQGAAHYHQPESDLEYRRLQQGNWSEYDSEKETQRMQAIKEYYERWPL